ncbi:glutamine--fructose-6-phosphate transaminase (isomerizing) [Acuticoccus sp. I52.16.1]|uniref:glutamine--fructose-6-phosphate transaminase (isomerizing) n=1 Tax=Acuticoccus sp. I52.16.1 TaxID=2928472 RepID=UPI001FD39308|nr:glutamine--fructose-6-phosphate transaminase (isomerizing) [Acuticoccus sp. I52.16.1]UOM34596.1 glutamine--fructose-6-phosphate transaminase (isomerizing) [Acuticoccus sp. I52.16.1]
MCGIVGVIGAKDAAPLILDALKRLEYRGYDSAGIAAVAGDGRMERVRAAGKLRNLEQRLSEHPLTGGTGIGHTRWATHGAPTDANAHPHLAEPVAVVHNGIIENFRALRTKLEAEGAVLTSETDTETIAHLMAHELASGSQLKEALVATLDQLEGAYALAFSFSGQPQVLAAARFGSPLAVGLSADLKMIGSDAIALAPFCDDIIYLEDGDIAILTPSGVEVYDAAGSAVERAAVPVPMQVSLAEKGNYRHFMAKEIHEQPEVIARTLSHYIDVGAGTLRPGAVPVDFAKMQRLSIAACGTAYFAGLVARYWFERLARLPVDLDVASEYRYRAQVFSPDDLALFISQSGETADTLAGLRAAKAGGQRLATVVNVPTSTMAREADVVLPTLAGPEIGVASTKAFTCQLSTLACLAVKAGLDRGTLSPLDAEGFVSALVELPRLVAEAVTLEHSIERVARLVAPATSALFLGRGTSYAVAMEGALKLKELSYIHAEAYAAGELKHGPIALVDEELPVIVVAPFDDLFAKTVSNMQEVHARGGRIIAVTDARGAHAIGDTAEELIVLPDVPAFVAPVVATIPLQLLAYHAAIINGTDVDQPRNLAKSVTVE